MAAANSIVIVFRLCAIATVCVLVVCCPARVCGYSNVGKAKLDVISLQQAVFAYKTKHSVWPESLRVLAERHADGDLAFVKEGLLVDPWGRPYHFDPLQLHPETNAPLIWSDGRDPADPDAQITNWPTPPDPWWRKAINALPWTLPFAGGGVLALAWRLSIYAKNSKPTLVAEQILVVIGCALLAGFCLFALTPRYLED
jgi:hypothetical protein